MAAIPCRTKLEPGSCCRRTCAQRLNALLGFLDESGFTQRPPIRATWAPRGQTPVVVEPFNHWKHLSGIGAVLTTVTGYRPRWSLAFHPGAICSRQVVRFVAALRRHVRRRVVLMWDRLPAHRSAGPRLPETHRPFLMLELSLCYENIISSISNGP